MMTRKDFEAVAEIIRTNSHVVSLSTTFEEGALFAGSSIADEICKVFKADNPQFDREKFQQACGFS